MTACTSLIQANSDSDRNLAVSYVNRAIASIKLNNPDQSIADLANAIRIWPTYARAFYVRGNGFLKKENVEQAISSFSQAITLNPSYAAAYSGRAFADAKARDFDRSIAEANAAINLDPTFALAYVARGTALGQKRDFERALGDLNRAIELNPRSSIAYNNRGLVLKLRGEISRAITDFSKAIDNDPNYVLAYRNRAAAWRDAGQFGRAIEDLNKVIGLGIPESKTLNDRGLAYYNLGDIDRSIRDFHQALALDRGNVSALVNRGLAREKKGDRGLALADFNAALAIDGNRSDAQAGRARIATVVTPLVGPPIARSTPTNSAIPAETVAQAGTASASGDNGPALQHGKSDPINANAQAQAPAVPVNRPLAEALVTCSKSKPQTQFAIEQSNGKGKLALPACYRGRAHLDCMVNAMVEEATAISRDYEAIVNSNYPNMNDVATICKIEPRQIEEHSVKAKAFDARAAALQNAFNSSATCVDSVHKTMTAIDLSSMKDSQALLRSILATTTIPLEQASVRQRDVIRLMQAIKDAQNSMTAVVSAPRFAVDARVWSLAELRSCDSLSFRVLFGPTPIGQFEYFISR
jgi:tetratricopeptide (TPR) repeat protein